MIDTHCHLDAPAFAADRQDVIARARQAGVSAIVMPAVDAGNFQAVRDLAHSTPGLVYALGIHPLYVDRAGESDLLTLQRLLEAWADDPLLVAVGEIGLDFFVPYMSTPAMRERQEHFYSAQLRLAGKAGLPVLLHARRSQDMLLRYLRRKPSVTGIVHAFNGSFQQAGQFIERGFALGMGGAMTFTRARQIRRLAAGLPASALVLETDAPDMPPAWLGLDASGAKVPARNEPAELAKIASVLAELRQTSLQETISLCTANALRILPRLQAALDARGLLGQGFRRD